MDLSPADYRAISGADNDNFGGNGSWFWIVVLFLFGGMNGGNGLFGGNGNREVEVVDSINNRFDFNQVDNKLTGISEGLCQLGYGVQNSIHELGAHLGMQNFEISKEIMLNRANDDKNTCAIITNANMNTRDVIENANGNTRAVIDKITNYEMQTLRDQLLGANAIIAQQNQTQFLVDTLRPTPAPAYTVGNPYAAYVGY